MLKRIISANRAVSEIRTNFKNWLKTRPKKAAKNVQKCYIIFSKKRYNAKDCSQVF